jgi:hypothetical protein
LVVARDKTNQNIRVNGAHACLSCGAGRLYRSLPTSSA